MSSPVHLDGNRGLVNVANRVFATIFATFADEAIRFLGVGVAVGNHVVESLPLVAMVCFVIVVFVEIFH